MSKKFRTLLTNNRGMTTLELLISVSLLAMVLMIVSGGLRFGGAVWQRGAEEHKEIMSLYSVQAHLSERLTSTLSYPIKARGGTKKLAFAGYPDRVMFVAPAVESDKKSILYLHELVMDSVRKKLLLKTIPLDPGNISMSHPPRDGASTLSREFSKIRVFYFDGESSHWVTSWLNKQELPKLIKLEMITTENASQDPHELIVEIGG